MRWIRGLVGGLDKRRGRREYSPEVELKWIRSLFHISVGLLCWGPRLVLFGTWSDRNWVSKRRISDPHKGFSITQVRANKKEHYNGRIRVRKNLKVAEGVIDMDGVCCWMYLVRFHFLYNWNTFFLPYLYCQEANCACCERNVCVCV